VEHTDYECYLLGCRNAGENPLEEWRFRLLQAEYLRRAAHQELWADRSPIPLWADRSPIPLFVLEQLAALVAEGYKIAAGGGSENSDDPGAAACGVRQPRVSLEPVLARSAARSLPILDAPDLSFWRT